MNEPRYREGTTPEAFAETHRALVEHFAGELARTVPPEHREAYEKALERQGSDYQRSGSKEYGEGEPAYFTHAAAARLCLAAVKDRVGPERDDDERTVGTDMNTLLVFAQAIGQRYHYRGGDLDGEHYAGLITAAEFTALAERDPNAAAAARLLLAGLVSPLGGA